MTQQTTHLLERYRQKVAAATAAGTPGVPDAGRETSA